MAKNKLFSSEISPACAYCAKGNLTKDGVYVLCEKKGVCRPEDFCKGFLYAPTKRVPKRPRKMMSFSHEDFTL